MFQIVLLNTPIFFFFMVTFHVFTVGPMKEPYGSTGLDGTPLRSLAFLYIKEQ